MQTTPNDYFKCWISKVGSGVCKRYEENCTNRKMEIRNFHNLLSRPPSLGFIQQMGKSCWWNGWSWIYYRRQLEVYSECNFDILRQDFKQKMGRKCYYPIGFWKEKCFLAFFFLQFVKLYIGWFLSIRILLLP